MINLKLFIFLILKLSQIPQIQSYQAKYRKVSSLKSYNTLSSTKAPKSEMQCCSICSRTLGCEGIMFEGGSCSFLSNPVENMDDATAAAAAPDSTNNWINTETNAIKTKLLVMTGKPEENGQKTEIIDLLDPNNHCVSIDYPHAIANGLGGLINPNVPMHCGGLPISSDLPTSSDCFVLSDGQFTQVESLESGVSWVSGAPVINGSLIIAGGYNGSPKLKRVFMVSPYEVKALKDLPFATGSHCTLKINDDKIMIASGHADTNYVLDTFVYDFADDEWTPSHLLNIGRGTPACGSFEMKGKTVLVVGLGYNGGYINSMEYLEWETNSGWVLGPPMVKGLGIASMVTTSTGPLVIGGKDNDDVFFGDIYQLKCSSQLIAECQWKSMEQKLQYPRGGFVAMLIPDSLAKDLCRK